MPSLNEDQFGRFSESKDYNTGYKHVYYEHDVTDRLPHEPASVRAAAQQIGAKSWSVRVHRGPHETKDESGSYYKDVGHYSLEGSASSIKSKLRSAVRAEAKNLRQSRG